MKASPCALDFVAASPYELVFSVPEDTSLKSSPEKTLHESVSCLPSLNRRIALCTQLASAVLHVDGELRMLHKNINTSNIILAEVKTGSEVSTTTDSALIISNWRYARDDSAATDLWHQMGEPTVSTLERQMALAEAKYSMGHDIYSLGVYARGTSEIAVDSVRL